MTQLTFAKDWIGKEYLPFTCGKEIVATEGGGENWLLMKLKPRKNNNNNNMILFVLYVVLTF